jgi:excinuclease ABC subunit B
VRLNVGLKISRNAVLFKLVDALYARTEEDFKRGTFRVKGDTVDVYLAQSEQAVRIQFWGDSIEEMALIDPISGYELEALQQYIISPANLFVTTRERIKAASSVIADDLTAQIEFFHQNGKPLEAKRLQQRVEYDLEMIRELGYCSGIENYSRYFDGRQSGTRPFCLLDYFPEDWLLLVDESHVSIPQIRAMYNGDRKRKLNLVEYGFRLPAALDNRPLKFEEFEAITHQTIYVSATPGDYELEQSEGLVVEQIIRPTGLLDPEIEVRTTKNQIDDLMEEIHLRAEKDERVLVTTLTKRMAEELEKFFSKLHIRCRYIHSEVDTLERVEIIRDLRLGIFDVLIGVNLLREGLDLPEVSLVAILDADKEGFLRNQRSLIQTIGRAARNVHGKVIMYADRITDSMRRAIDETDRRREKQMRYNLDHGMRPTALQTSKESILKAASVSPGKAPKVYAQPDESVPAAEPQSRYLSPAQRKKKIEEVRRSMEAAAKAMDFMEAAKWRDILFELQATD